MCLTPARCATSNIRTLASPAKPYSNVECIGVYNILGWIYLLDGQRRHWHRSRGVSLDGAWFCIDARHKAISPPFVARVHQCRLYYTRRGYNRVTQKNTHTNKKKISTTKSIKLHRWAPLYTRSPHTYCANGGVSMVVVAVMIVIIGFTNQPKVRTHNLSNLSTHSKFDISSGLVFMDGLNWCYTVLNLKQYILIKLSSAIRVIYKN